MNIKNYNDKSLESDSDYQNFLKDNPDYGYLKIRASSANEALPVKGVKIIVSKIIGDNKVVFYEGETDESGMINDIKLPSPPKVESDDEVPKFADYDVEASYPPLNFNKVYHDSICCNINVIQYVSIFPKINTEMRKIYGN